MTPEEFRKFFPHLSKMVYLNHAAVSPQNSKTIQAIQEYFRERSTGDVEYWPALYEKKQEFKSLVAQMIHASQENIAVVQNTSMGLNMLAKGLDWKSGDRILLNNFEFPANVYPFLHLQRLGVEVDFVEHRQGEIRMEDIAAKITPRTRLISISFVEFLNGFRNDLEALGQLCREKDIIFCVDGIQGVGALKMDVQKYQIDFLSNGGHKWLMWPLGVGFVYISPRIFDRVYPVLGSWLSVKDAWNFFDYRLDFLPTAERFEGGALNGAGLIGAITTARLFLDVGLEQIEKRVLENSTYLIQQLKMHGYRLFTPEAQKHRSGIVTFYHDRAEALHQFLKDQHIYVSLRTGMIRVSPHFYNTQEELDKLIEFLLRFDNK